jgi:hypothetical protein
VCTRGSNWALLRGPSTSPLGAMRHPARTTALITLCVLLLSACRTPAPPPASSFTADWSGLFLAVTKSFGTRTYYVGSDNQWAYFETQFEDSLVTPTYRKVETSRMHLPQTFPLGQGKPYRIYLTNFVGYENAGGQGNGA